VKFRTWLARLGSAAAVAFLVAESAATADGGGTLGVRIRQLEASNLHMYDCRLRVDLRNGIGETIRVLAATLRLYDAEGRTLTVKPFETQRIGAGAERREALGFKLDVEGGLRPATQQALASQCDVIADAEIILHACIGLDGDLFGRCSSSMFVLSGSELPLRFAAVRREIAIGEAEDASVERPDEAETLVLADYGMTLSTITEGLAERYRLSAEQTGLLVVDVAGDGVAKSEGIAAGDVIVEVDQQEVAALEDLRERIAAAEVEGRAMLILIDRAGAPVFTVLPGA